MHVQRRGRVASTTAGRQFHLGARWISRTQNRNALISHEKILNARAKASFDASGRRLVRAHASGVCADLQREKTGRLRTNHPGSGGACDDRMRQRLSRRWRQRFWRARHRRIAASGLKNLRADERHLSDFARRVGACVCDANARRARSGSAMQSVGIFPHLNT